jgi:hypothetical protein
MTREEIEDLLEAFRANDAMENTRWYLMEGRRYARLTEEVLHSVWLSAWRDFHIHLKQSARDDYNDASAELRLRGLALPEHLIDPVQLEQAQARLREITDRPDVRARIMRDIRRFQEELATPRN